MSEDVHPIRLKRAYQEAAAEDGNRILVERLWPRGLTKEKATIDVWLKEVSPSPDLRRWYGHDPERWEEFRKRYETEMQSHEDPIRRIRDLQKTGPLTFVFAARDEQRNSAVVLKAFIERNP